MEGNVIKDNTIKPKVLAPKELSFGSGGRHVNSGRYVDNLSSWGGSSYVVSSAHVIRLRKSRPPTSLPNAAASTASRRGFRQASFEHAFGSRPKWRGARIGSVLSDGVLPYSAGRAKALLPWPGVAH
jgi:hypothetical protein